MFWYPTYDSSWLEDFLDLTIDTLPLGGVASGLNGVDSIEGVLAELLVELHKVTLDD